MPPPPFPKPVLMSPATVTALQAPRRRPRPRPGSTALREQPCDSPAPEDTPTRGPRGPLGSSHAGCSVAESGAALLSRRPAAAPTAGAVWAVGTDTRPTASEHHCAPGTVLCLHLPSTCRVQGGGQETGPEPTAQFQAGHPTTTPPPLWGPQPCSAPKPDCASAPPSSAPLPKLWVTPEEVSVTFSSQLSHLPPPAQGLPFSRRQGSQRKGNVQGSGLVTAPEGRSCGQG